MKINNQLERGIVFFLYILFGLAVPLFIIWIVLSIVISFFYDFTMGQAVYSFLYLVLPIYTILALVSPNISALLIKLNGARRPRLHELNLLVPVISELHKKCRPDKTLSLYVLDDPMTPNAMVLGSGLIFTTGLINQATEDELLAVAAHEFGHLHYGDSSFNIVIAVLMFPYQLLVKALMGLISICRSLPILYLVIGLPAALLSGLLLLVALPMNLLLNVLSRNYEYRADKYASDLGYKEGLQSFLEQLLARENKQTFIEKLFSTHPSTAKRLLKLEQ